jgi:lysozyme
MPSRVPPLSNFTALPKGIDFSSQQANWTFLVEHGRVRGGEIAFAILQATFGAKGKQKQFPANWAGLRETKLVRGAYHFLHTNHIRVPDPKNPGRVTGLVQSKRDVVLQDAQEQAKNYIAVVGKLDGALPPILDIEWQTLQFDPQGKPLVILDPKQHSENTLLTAQTWIDRIKAEYKRDPIIYTNAEYWKQLGNPNRFSEFPLWVAEYHNPLREGPHMPGSWSDWTLWQFAGNTFEVAGVFAGAPKGNPQDGSIRGKSDLNVFNGSLRQLLRLTDQTLEEQVLSSSTGQQS